MLLTKGSERGRGGQNLFPGQLNIVLRVVIGDGGGKDGHLFAGPHDLVKAVPTDDPADGAGTGGVFHLAAGVAFGDEGGVFFLPAVDVRKMVVQCRQIEVHDQRVAQALHRRDDEVFLRAWSVGGDSQMAAVFLQMYLDLSLGDSLYSSK